MATAIYCFSATGNSLTTARKLAERLEDCRVIPIASLKDRSKVIEEANVIGFVFPVYYGDMPYPVRAAISKMVFADNAYIFILPTYRGHAGDVAARMDLLLRSRGQRLSLSLGLPMPGNSFINAPEADREHLEKQEERIAALLEPIRQRQTHCYAPEEVPPLTPVAYPNNFRGIAAEAHCIGCGTCAKVCPMDNIEIRDGRAVIGDDCATCLACFHWCPVQAIWMSRQENIARRSKYRHPQVTIGDIIAQKKENHLV